MELLFHSPKGTSYYIRDSQFRYMISLMACAALPSRRVILLTTLHLSVHLEEKGFRSIAHILGKPIHMHSHILFRNLQFAAVPTLGILISCTAMKSNSFFRIEWLGGSTKRRIHLFLVLCTSSHHRFSRPVAMRVVRG